MAKPASKPDWTLATPAVRVEPSGSEKSNGWGIDQRPPREFMNWLFYNITLWINYFESVTDAIPTQLQSGNYSALTSDRNILVDASGGSYTISLPVAATSVGAELVIKKIDATANTVTIDGNASEAIDGALTQVLTNQYESMTIVCFNGGWHIL